MHPRDATARGLQDGAIVTVWNARGAVTLQLKLTEATRPGVLYSAKGTWRSTSQTGFTVNALIPADIRTDIEEGACYHETFVEVKPAP